jgi:hypothetical protein
LFLIILPDIPSSQDDLYLIGTITGEPNARIIDVKGIGDINGDGYNDFTIKGVFRDWGSERGKVFLYFGGTKIDTIPKYEFYEPWGQDWFGQDIEGVNDLNKDGYDDFIISSPYNWSTGKGDVYLFYGGNTISFSRSIIFVDTQAIGKSMLLLK